MSATMRGANRHESDNYPTPGWCVRRLLEAVAMPGFRWLEPCAGEGAIVRELRNHAPHGPRVSPYIDTRDIRPCVAELYLAGASYADVGDYLDVGAAGTGHHAAITNPPFSHAFEFAQKLVAEVPWVALLLRLNWLGSGTKSGRTEWLRAHPPDVYVLPNRPSFTPDGKSDSVEYAWFVWPDNRGPQRTQGRIQILANTPASERKASP